MFGLIGVSFSCFVYVLCHGAYIKHHKPVYVVQLIPPAVARNLADLTNHHVYLEDLEKRRSEVGLSVVNDSLAFY